MSNRTISACPECDSTNVYHRHGDGYLNSHTPDDTPKWICYDCHNEFDEAITREPHDVSAHDGLASKLESASQSDVGENWFCEECGSEQAGVPAHVESVDGPEGTIELWFCAECTRTEVTRGRYR